MGYFKILALAASLAAATDTVIAAPAVNCKPSPSAVKHKPKTRKVIVEIEQPYGSKIKVKVGVK